MPLFKILASYFSLSRNQSSTDSYVSFTNTFAPHSSAPVQSNFIAHSGSGLTYSQPTWGDKATDPKPHPLQTAVLFGTPVSYPLMSVVVRAPNAFSPMLAPPAGFSETVSPVPPFAVGSTAVKPADVVPPVYGQLKAVDADGKQTVMNTPQTHSGPQVVPFLGGPLAAIWAPQMNPNPTGSAWTVWGPGGGVAPSTGKGDGGGDDGGDAGGDSGGADAAAGGGDSGAADSGGGGGDDGGGDDGGDDS